MDFRHLHGWGSLGEGAGHGAQAMASQGGWGEQARPSRAVRAEPGETVHI